MKFLLAAVAVVSLPQARESVELVSREAVGDVYEEKESSWVSSTTSDADSDGVRPAFEARAPGADVTPIPSASEMHRTILDEVLAVNDGKRVKVKRTFVEGSSTTADAGGATPQSRLAPFEGQTIVVQADGDGTRLVGEIDGEEELTASDRSLSTRWEEILPGAPVAQDETWSLSEETARHLLEGFDVSRASAWCTLGGFERSATGERVRIKLEISATTAAGSAGSLELRASGEVLWDTAAGHLAEARLSGELQGTDADGSAASVRFGVTHEVRKVE